MRFKIFITTFLLPLTLLAEMGYVEPWGKDAGIALESSSLRPAPKELTPLGQFAEKGIYFHQHVLTHISGPRSHYRPTSSQYMLEAIREHGFFKGYIMGCDRLLRENGDPWVYRTKEIKGTLYKWDSPTQQTRCSTFLGV